MRSRRRGSEGRPPALQSEAGAPAARRTPWIRASARARPAGAASALQKTRDRESEAAYEKPDQLRFGKYVNTVLTKRSQGHDKIFRPNRASLFLSCFAPIPCSPPAN